MFIVEIIIGLFLLGLAIILLVDVVLPSMINKPFFWFTKSIIKGGVDKNLVVKQQELQETLVQKRIQELEKEIIKLKKENGNE